MDNRLNHARPEVSDMTVHILNPDDHVFSLNRLTARIGFLTLGEEVKMFQEETFDDISLEENDIVVGGVGFVKRGLKRLGLIIPEIDLKSVVLPEPFAPWIKYIP